MTRKPHAEQIPFMLDSITSPVSEELALMEEALPGMALCNLGSADKAAASVLGPGGKRLRSALFFLAARLLSETENGYGQMRGEIVKVGAAIELMHAASLLHDDVTDASDERRGRPTANALFGETASVLTGDLLWCAASESVVETGNMRLVQAFVSTARSMATGQIMEHEGVVDAGSYMKMIEAKSASLFSLAAGSAAILCSAPADTERALSDYGLWTGMAFQIADDIMDRAEDSARRSSSPCMGCLGGEQNALLAARDFAKKAARLSENLPGGPEARSLSLLAEYSVGRAL